MRPTSPPAFPSPRTPTTPAAPLLPLPSRDRQGAVSPPLLLTLTVALAALLASGPDAGDWPMWGGSPERNMVSAMPGSPTSWDVKTRRNVKWMAELGSQSYGNPVVAGGQVYAGTNNELVRNSKEPGDRGVLMCFREADGQFLWQHTHEKLEDSNQDWRETRLCSSPLV